MPPLKLHEQFEVPGEAERTPELFWETNDWGERSGLSLVQHVWLWHRAEENYADVVAHNFDHATDVLWYGNNWADKYDAAFPDKPRIKRKLLNAALLFHDAGCDEAEAATNFGHYAKELGYDEDEVVAVQSIIMSSAENIDPTTPEEVIMNLSDLHTAGEPWSIFRSRGEAFLKEARQALGKAFIELQFRVDNAGRLAKFITKNLSLGGLEKEWLQAARDNVRRQIGEIAEQRHQSLSALAQELGSKAINELIGDRLSKSRDGTVAD